MSDLSEEDLRRIYAETKSIAVVGASTDPSKSGHVIPAYLQSQGFTIIPVSPRGGEIFGEQVAPSLADVTTPIDVVNVFRPAAEGPAVVAAAADAGARVVWFQPGTESVEAETAAADAGLVYVGGICIGVTHGTLGLGPGPYA